MRKYFLPLIPFVFLSGVKADATPITYTATLLGSSEFPPNASPGFGVATIVFDAVLQTLQVDVSFQDLVDDVIAAHIHCCTTAAQTGVAGVATQVPSFINFPTGTAGSYSNFFDLTDPLSWNPAFIAANGGTTAGAVAALDNGLKGGKAYFNIHTRTFPGGEIRGFLPEPATVGLIALGLAALGFARRKRQ